MIPADGSGEDDKGGAGIPWAQTRGTPENPMLFSVTLDCLSSSPHKLCLLSFVLRSFSYRLNLG